MGAYNNHDMAARGLVFDKPTYWWGIKHFKMLALGATYKSDNINKWTFINNSFTCILEVIPGNAIEAFVFEDPGAISGQITNVAIWAYVQGKTKIAMGLLNQTVGSYPGNQYFYYGPETKTEFIWDWLHLDFPQNPGLIHESLGQLSWDNPRAWNWNDLRPGTNLSLIGGVYLHSNSSIKAVKAVVDYIDSAGVAQQITLLPTKDVRGGTVFYTPPGTTDQIIRWYNSEYLGAVANVENHLGIIGYIKDNFPIDYGYVFSTTELIPHKVQCVMVSFQVLNIPPPEAIIYSINVTVNPSYKGSWLFIRIGGVYYRGQVINTPGGWTNVWNRNPATNQPWDLAGVQSIEFFGIADGWFDQVASWNLGIVFSDLHLDIVCANPAHNQINTKSDIYIHRDAYSDYVGCGISFSDYPCMGLFQIEDHSLALQANIARHSSNFSSIPPRNSVIISVNVSYGFRGLDTRGGSYLRPFFYFDGVYHYGPSKPLGVNPWIRQDFDYTFYAPTYDQLQGGRFGLEIYNPDTYYNLTCFVEDLYAEITFQERADVIEYQKQAVAEDSIVFAQYSQNPIKPDDLYFTLDAGNFLPERTELVYVQQGVQVWNGVVWTQKESQNHEVAIWARSRQILLFVRNIPNFFYHSRSTRWSGVYSLQKLFSDDLPEFPYVQYPASKDDTVLIAFGHTYHIGTRYTALTETELGLFFLINSALIQGIGEATGKIPGMASLVRNRAMFSTNHDPTLGWQNDFTGSVHRLTQGISPTCADGEYFLSGDDLYVKPLPDSLMILADHAVDTYIRPGDNDLGEYYLNVPNIFKGAVNVCFNEFFELMGQELQFRPSSGATVRMNAGIEIARGSATEPLRKFEHGVNCLVSKKAATEPTPTAVVGSSTIPQVSTEWARARQYILKIISDATRDGEDLRAYLALQREQDDTFYTVDYSKEEPLLRVGDYIWVKPENMAFKPVRIQKNLVTHGHTQLTAGKRLFSASKRFGQWRNATGTTSQDHKIVSQAIDLQGTGGVQAFTVSAADLADDDWRCRLSLNLAQKITFDPTLNTTTIVSKGGATLTVTGPYTGSAANTYEVEIVSGGYWYLIDVVTPAYVYPTWHWRKNGGAWSGVQSLYRPYAPVLIWPLENGISFVVNFNIGSYHNQNNIAGAKWQIAAINPARVKEYALTPKILRLKLNGRYIPPGRHLFIDNSETVDIDISDYVVVGSNSLDISLQNGMTLANSPNWYHTLKGSIDQYKRVKAVLND